MSFDLALLIVSFRPDFSYLRRLLDSIEKYNVDKLPVILILPKDDIELAKSTLPLSNIKYIFEEEWFSKDIELGNVGNFRRGYIMQGIIKLHAWKLGIAKNYFSVDSDTYFIRNFGKSDFFNFEDQVYSILSQEKYLRVEPSFRSYDLPRQPKIDEIRKRVDVQDSRLLQSQVNVILSSKVLESFTTEGMEFLRMNYTSLFSLAPYEYGWYGFWLQKSKLIPIIPIEPLIYNFYTRGLYENALFAGISETDIARGYIGISKNSNWYGRYTSRTKLQKFEARLRDVRRVLRLQNEI